MKYCFIVLLLLPSALFCMQGSVITQEEREALEIVVKQEKERKAKIIQKMINRGYALGENEIKKMRTKLAPVLVKAILTHCQVSSTEDAVIQKLEYVGLFEYPKFANLPLLKFVDSIGQEKFYRNVMFDEKNVLDLPLSPYGHQRVKDIKMVCKAYKPLFTKQLEGEVRYTNPAEDILGALGILRTY